MDTVTSTSVSALLCLLGTRGAAHPRCGGEAWHAQAAPTVRKLAKVGLAATAPTRWVTRVRPKIDRLACPWLVRRFIDPLVEIAYAAAHAVVDRARAIGGVSFDLPGVRLSHRAERCSFDAISEDFDLRVPGLDTLETIVRGADTGRLDLAPQAPGLLAISLGRGRNIAGDDALYLWCRDAQTETHGRSLLA